MIIMKLEQARHIVKEHIETGKRLERQGEATTEYYLAFETVLAELDDAIECRDAAIADLAMIEHCGTCKYEESCQLGTCENGCYEWKGVRKRA